MPNSSNTYLSLCLLFFSLSYTVSVAHGKLVNVTVDDQLGASNSDVIPTCEPPEAWNEGPQCTTCAAHPDPSQTYKGTWHDSTTKTGEQSAVITYDFNGKSSESGQKR